MGTLLGHLQRLVDVAVVLADTASTNPFGDRATVSITKFAAQHHRGQCDAIQDGLLVVGQRRVMHGHAQHAGDLLSTRFEQYIFAVVAWIGTVLDPALASKLTAFLAGDVDSPEIDAFNQR